MHSSIASIAGVIVLGVSAGFASAQHAGDILLERNYENRIHTGGIDINTSEPIHNLRVFQATFGESPNFTNDPGMDSGIGGFPFPSAVGFNIRGALRKWDGQDFDEIPVETIRIRLGSLGPVFTPPTDQIVPGFSMNVGSDGEFHHHPGFTLQSPASTGIYLLELELWSTDPTILPSRPHWIVFNQNDSQANHDAATEWVVENKIGCVSDFDVTGFTDGDDFDAFVRGYEAGDFTADVDGTGFVDTDDFDFFVARFEAGC